MSSGFRTFAAALAVGAALSLGLAGAQAAETPKKGGILKFVVPAEPPSRSEERRVGKSVSVRVDLGGRRIIKKKKTYRIKKSKEIVNHKTIYTTTTQCNKNK